MAASHDTDTAREFAIEHHFPVAWTFVSLLIASALGSTMLMLIGQA